MNISVLTLVRDRRAHLINLIHGLNAQQEPPAAPLAPFLF